MAARFLRVEISTALRWIGDDEKCFRLEVLGCGPGSQANTGLTAVAEPAGYLAVGWNPPTVQLPGHPNQVSVSLTAAADKNCTVQHFIAGT